MTRRALAFFLCVTCFGQEPFVARPKTPIFWRPYEGPTVPPVRTTNSDRLHSLIRAGRLYLTLQDAIGLAIENNLDLEIDRYGPQTAEWMVERAQAGGAIRGVPAGNNFVNQAVAGQCISGALLTAGLSSGGGGGGGSNTNTQIAQVGPITPNLDPVFQNSSAWSHITTPVPDTLLSETPALVDVTHKVASFGQEGLITGGLVQVSVNEYYCRENSPNDIINPSFAPVAQIYVKHNLLNGFGAAVNGRFIRVAQKQLEGSRETFRSQLLNLVANVVNLYWDLVAAQEDLEAKRQTLEIADKFLRDTKARIEVGEIAGADIFRAQAEYSTRSQEVLIAEGTFQQREVILKDALSRNGLADPELDAAEVVPMDRLQPPAEEELPPLRELVAKALAARPDIAVAKIADEAQRISAVGTANGLLPSLQVIATTTARAEAGPPNPVSGVTPSSNIVGGLGSAFAEIFTAEYTSRSGTLYFSGTLKNHVAQADYGIDQLQIAQGGLMEQRTRNQLVVDISNQIIALRQARSRFSQAVDTRILQEQLLDKEQQQFLLGGSSIEEVVAAERSLATAQYAEVATLASYSRARVGLDQVLGQTLEANHVSVEEALSGR
jgi:outer membrane protein